MKPPSVDLAVEGATVVGPDGRRAATLYVQGGRVEAVGGPRRAAAKRVDVRGLLLFPGFVDTHVHLMEPADPSREDWAHGTAAAAASGVTTIVEHTHAAPVRDATEIEEKIAWCEGRSHVDYGLAAHAWPDRLEAVAGAWAAGPIFLKVFTCATHGVPGFDARTLHTLFRETRRVGAICLVHCEDEELTGRAEARLRAESRTDGGVLPAWRNREAELAAVTRVVDFAAQTGARAVIAHASHVQVLELVAKGQRVGADVVAETCPQYLTLLEDDVEREFGLRKFTPPARARSAADLDAMWSAVADGLANHISSDHAPSTLAQKARGTIWEVPFGLPGLDTTSSILIDAALNGRITLERLAEVYADAPARRYGLSGKGLLEPGADADFLLVDPGAVQNLTGASIHSKAGWTPYEGRLVRGRVVATYLRGTAIYADGQITGEYLGRLVRGSGAAPYSRSRSS